MSSALSSSPFGVVGGGGHTGGHRLRRGACRPDWSLIEDEPGLFGGLAFLINGHLAVAASAQGGLKLRVNPARTESLPDEPHGRPMVMRGREMDGWLRIIPAALSTDETLARSVRRGVEFARGLPPKRSSSR